MSKRALYFPHPVRDSTIKTLPGASCMVSIAVRPVPLPLVGASPLPLAHTTPHSLPSDMTWYRSTRGLSGGHFVFASTCIVSLRLRGGCMPRYPSTQNILLSSADTAVDDTGIRPLGPPRPAMHEFSRSKRRRCKVHGRTNPFRLESLSELGLCAKSPNAPRPFGTPSSLPDVLLQLAL